jgi:hypothetical protein
MFLERSFWHHGLAYASAFPGRSAACNAALLTRDRSGLGVCHGPGSAMQHCMLHRVRET